GDTVDSVFISVHPAMPQLAFRVPETQVNKPGAGPVSVALLRHKVPGKARKELELALRADKNNDDAAAVEHLQKALALDPDFMEAHNTLAIRYMAKARDDIALAEFRKALALDPQNSGLHANVAAGLLRTHHPVEAETEARRSLEFDSTNPR